MDRKAAAFARSWATRYVRTKHPHGLDVEDVENRILESLYKYSRGKMNGRDSARPSQDGETTAPQWMMKALSEALNEIQNESRRNLRAIRSHVARANASGKAVNRADIARSLGVTLPTYEKRFSLIKSMLGIRL